MISKMKTKTRSDLLKELNRLIEVFSNIKKQFKERGEFSGLEVEFQKAQEDLDQFWADLSIFNQEGRA